MSTLDRPTSDKTDARNHGTTAPSSADERDAHEDGSSDQDTKGEDDGKGDTLPSGKFPQR